MIGSSFTPTSSSTPKQTLQSTQSNSELMSVHKTTLVAYQPTVPGKILSGQGGATNYITHHTVQEDESLSLIAAKYGINTQTIFWANDISSEHTIQVGDVLSILPIDGVLHEVQNGETLLAIANHYDVEAQAIIHTNDLEDPEHIFMGQELLVPGADIQAPTRTVSQVRSAQKLTTSGYFIRPAQGILSQGLHSYNAIDIANSCNTTPIYAAASGTVEVVTSTGRFNGGYGNYIRVAHPNGTKTLYAHLATRRALVSIGQWVRQGQTIGYMGTTGRSTGCHLHFEVHGAVNPIR